MDVFVILFVVVVLGSILRVALHVGVAILIAKPMRDHFRQWNGLSEGQKADLLRKLSTMPSSRRASLMTGYMPIREEMAGMAAANGIDPSFLYK